jgi:hypothetical protein
MNEAVEKAKSAKNSKLKQKIEIQLAKIPNP